MAQTARTEADKATDNVAELGKRTADAALEAERAVARRSVEGAGEVGRAFAELVREQARHNVAVLQALSRTVDWEGAAQVQGDFVRASVERATAFTRRYLEMVQAVIASAASTAEERAREAA